MMKLIQNIDVYAPQHLGKKDVLIINDKIQALYAQTDFFLRQK